VSWDGHLRPFPRETNPLLGTITSFRPQKTPFKPNYEICGLMATPKGTRAQRFLLKSGDAVHIYSNLQSITLQLRHEVPSEADVAATSFKASVVLTPGDALAIAGELLTVAAAQLKPKP
jgi:hypothetical protein